MDMQKGQLDALRQWLTKTEDRISHMVGINETSHTSHEEQLRQLSDLERDIEEQQVLVDALRNMVVVVDEENSEAVYAQMEDLLSALSERWTHICKWKEERAEKLRSFSSNWRCLMDEYKKSVGSITEMEITLKQMEAVPVSEIGEILERVKKLQNLRAEMSKNEKKLGALQRSVQELSENGSSVECNDLLEKIENLQDQLEAVGLIMEVQSQRMSSSGFEFDTRTDTETNIVTGNEWMTETVTSIAYKKEHSGTLEQQSDSKKRRIASTTRQTFETSLSNLYKWLDYVDLEIGRSEGVFDELSVEEKTVVYEETIADLDLHKSEYERVLEAGKRLIDELDQSNESYEDEKAKIRDVENCWQATNNRLNEIKERIDLLMEVKQYRTELASLNMMLDGYLKWFEANQANTPTIEPLTVKIKSMKSHEERIKKLVAKTSLLNSSETQTEIVRDVKNFTTVWDDLLKKLSNRLAELSNFADKTPPKRYSETMAELMAFINNAESILLSEHAVVSDRETMEKQQKRFEKLQNSIKEYEMKFNYVNSTGQEFIAKISEAEPQAKRFIDELQDLNTKWSDIPVIFNERQQKLSKGMKIIILIIIFRTQCVWKVLRVVRDRP